MPTADEQEFVQKTEANIAVVSDLILAANPGAGHTELGGVFDGYGQAVWAPARNPKIDYSSWGRWEVWEEKVPHTIGGVSTLVGTGAWACWDSETREAQIFSDKSVLTGKQQAEWQAVYWNEGKPTRVVDGCLVYESCLAYEMVKARVDGRMAQDAAVDEEQEAKRS